MGNRRAALALRYLRTLEGAALRKMMDGSWTTCSAV